MQCICGRKQQPQEARSNRGNGMDAGGRPKRKKRAKFIDVRVKHEIYTDNNNV